MFSTAAESLSRLQATELEILLAVKEVCERHGIVFFLDSGTLLGAARHQGFIPWDDDIDIAMPREDYERFLAIAQSELGDLYFLQTKQTDRFSLVPFAKVRKNGTTMLERAEEEVPSHHGIWIDIFPFDPIADTDENFAKKEKKWWFWRKLQGLRSVGVASKEAGPIKSMARKMVRLPLLLLPESYFDSKVEAFRERDIFSEGSALTCFYYFDSLIRLPYKDVFPLKYLKFEGYEFPVIASWEKYLSDVYGDWKTLPPEEERVSHNLLAIDFGE